MWECVPVTRNGQHNGPCTRMQGSPQANSIGQMALAEACHQGLPPEEAGSAADEASNMEEHPQLNQTYAGDDGGDCRGDGAAD